MVNKRLLVGIGAMLVGGALFVTGLFRIPVVSIVLILMGGAIGFVGFYIYERRRGGKPNDLNYG